MLSRSGCRCGRFLGQFRMGTNPQISFFQPQKLFLDPSGPAAGNALGVWWGEEIGSVCSKPPPSLFCSLLPLPRPLPAVFGKRFFLSFWLYFSQLGKGGDLWAAPRANPAAACPRARGREEGAGAIPCRELGTGILRRLGSLSAPGGAELWQVHPQPGFTSSLCLCPPCLSIISCCFVTSISERSFLAAGKGAPEP